MINKKIDKKEVCGKCRRKKICLFAACHEVDGCHLLEREPRLVDANELFKAISDGKYTTGNIFKDMELQEFIKNIPTAYDIDKVVGQLEEASVVMMDLFEDDPCYVIHEPVAIEIVRKGGVE